MEPSWPYCSETCTGIRLWDGPCLAHAEPERQKQALATLGDGADLDFTRGVPIDGELLKRILEATPWEDGRPVLQEANFSRATFGDGADFRWATFGQTASFEGATFGRWANFGPLLVLKFPQGTRTGVPQPGSSDVREPSFN